MFVRSVWPTRAKPHRKGRRLMQSSPAVLAPLPPGAVGSGKPPGTGPQPEAAAVKATGTDDLTPSPLVPVLVPTTGKPCKLGSILDKATSNRGEAADIATVAVSACPACPVKAKSPLTSAVNGLYQERETGLGPATSSLGS